MVTDLNWTPIFERCVVRCRSNIQHQKDAFKRDWTTCSEFVKYSRFDSPHIGGDPYDHLIWKRIFTLIMNKTFI